jgi:hypothetical protein
MAAVPIDTARARQRATTPVTVVANGAACHRHLRPSLRHAAF